MFVTDYLLSYQIYCYPIIGLDMDVTTPKILFNKELSSPIGSKGE